MTALAAVPDPEQNKPTASVVIVDPVVAERWLGRNVRNRRIRARVVNAYAADMAAGNWKLTGEAVKFAKSGKLLDGQHRLLAVIQAQVSVPMFVVRGIDDDAQDVMDTNSRRTAGDVLTLHGLDSGNLLAASAKWAILFDTDRLYVDRAARTVTHSDIVEYVQDNDALTDAISLTQSLRRHIDLQPSLLATAIYLVMRSNPTEAIEFFGRLADGVGLAAGSPILALRSRLREIKNNRQRVEGEAFLSLVIRTWNAYREGRTMASIPIYRGKASIRCPQPRA